MRARVLIVEDHSLIALAMGEQAALLGHHVVGPVATVAAANDLIGSEIIDCALVDYQLADGPADALVERLDEASVPFAWLSGCDEADLPSGAAAILPKPFAGEAIRQLLENLPRRAA